MTVKEGYAEWLDMVCRTHRRRVFTMAYRMVRNLRDADDVTQEVFAKLWKHPDAYDPAKGEVWPWLCRVTANTARDFLRRRFAHPEPVSLDEPDAEEIPGGVEPEEVHAGLLRHELVQRLLASRPEQERQAVKLHCLDGLTWPEVAQEMHCCESWARRCGTHCIAAMRR
jgi:RNA polymerase sigma-70 factor (ECF subfamily)